MVYEEIAAENKELFEALELLTRIRNIFKAAKIDDMPVSDLKYSAKAKINENLKHL